MKRNLFFLFLLPAFFFCTALQAQTIKSDSLFLPAGMKMYQFNLEKPALKIDELRYEKSGEPIKGTLTRDGGRVLMQNYQKGQRVQVRVTYADGTDEVISRSPCYIDPVTYEL